MLSSFRDPSGFVAVTRDRVVRFVGEAGAADLEASLDSAALKGFVSRGELVGAAPLDPGASAGALRELAAGSPEGFILARAVEHERVPFQNFPYEWPPEMLCAAAELTLRLAEATLGEGLGLKDATPYNVLFRGPAPVFIDWLSFERREPADPVWLPNAQFVRTFLLPLLVNGSFGLRLDRLLLPSRDGVEPETVFRMCGPTRRLRPPFLSLVTMPTLLSRGRGASGEAIYRPRRVADPERARFILRRQYAALRRQLRKVAPAREAASGWADYMGAGRHFTESYLRRKREFVERALGRSSPATVLDIGCNTGHFSRVAARAGARVVAVDSDPAVVGRLWRAAVAEGLDILPLVVDLARPSPSVGWRNRENTSFLCRAKGAFDAVLMLAVAHHLTVAERVPLAEVLDLASELTTATLLVEFVGTDDPMFRRLTRGREQLFSHLSREHFEAACSRRFEHVRSEELEEGKRWIYLLRKR